MELLLNVLIVEVRDILAKIELGPFIIAPVLVLENVVFLLRNVELTGTAVLFLQLLDRGALLLDSIDDGLRDESFSSNVVALLRLSNMQLRHDGFGFLGVLGLERQSMINKNIARLRLHISDAVTGLVTHLNHVCVGLLGETLDLLAHFLVKLSVLAQIDFGEHNDERLGLEQRLDCVKEANLLLYGVAASLRDVHEEQDAGIEMRESGHSLHFDRVSLVQLMIQDAGRVDNLVARHLVLGVTDEQTLSCERVRLHIDVRARHVVDQARLTNVGETRQDERPRVGVNTGQSTKMLSHFFKVAQTGLELLDESAHATESSSLKLLAAIQ